MTDAEQYSPLKPDVFLILLILLEGEHYGYGIIKEAEERSEGRVKLQAGALYRRLKWMLDEGLIEELDYKPVDEADERRRYYRATALGREVARVEAERMAELVDAARLQKLLKPDTAR